MNEIDDLRRYALSALRNRGPIADVLAEHLPSAGLVLEAASGTGEHVCHFAERFPGLQFQPSDPDPGARASVAAWIAATGLRNVRKPLGLDVSVGPWPEGPFDAVISINMIHISPWNACLGLLEGAAESLTADGFLFLYGPFLRAGVQTAFSNEAFDADLRARNPAWGLRDLDEVAEHASEQGLMLAELVEMPANNLSVIFRRALSSGLRKAGAPLSPGLAS
jgi:cyclopropane fatty-acyl-phospholipid synthase-like methyltransferase